MRRCSMSIQHTATGKWKVRWIPRGDRERSRTFIRKGDAEKFHAAVIAEKDAERRIIEPMWRKVLRTQLDDRAEILTDHLNPQGSFVYLLWGASEDKPVYVGMSTNVLSRLGSHMNNETKRQRVTKVTLIRCYSIEDARALELRLIRFYNPELNIADNLNGECVGCGKPRDGVGLYCSADCRRATQTVNRKTRKAPGSLHLTEISDAHRRAVQKLAAQQ